MESGVCGLTRSCCQIFNFPKAKFQALLFFDIPYLYAFKRHILPCPQGVELQKFWFIFTCASFSILTTTAPNLMLVLKELTSGAFLELNFRAIVVPHSHSCQLAFSRLFSQANIIVVPDILYVLERALKKDYIIPPKNWEQWEYRDITVRHIAETKEQRLQREVGCILGGVNFYHRDGLLWVTRRWYWPMSTTFTL